MDKGHETSVALFSPYGDLNQESGLLHLLGKYISTVDVDVFSLECDGVFSVCNRDQEFKFNRQFHSCLSCMGSQSKYQKWSGARSVSLSQYQSGSARLEQERILSRLKGDELREYSCFDQDFEELCRETINAKFGLSGALGSSVDQDNFRRKCYQSVHAIIDGARACLKDQMPDICFIAGGEEMLSRGFVIACELENIPFSCFRWDVHQRSVQISHPAESSTLSSELIVTDLLQMRSEVNTWPSDLLALVYEIIDFVGIARPIELLEAAP